MINHCFCFYRAPSTSKMCLCSTLPYAMLSQGLTCREDSSYRTTLHFVKLTNIEHNSNPANREYVRSYYFANSQRTVTAFVSTIPLRCQRCLRSTLPYATLSQGLTCQEGFRYGLTLSTDIAQDSKTANSQGGFALVVL